MTPAWRRTSWALPPLFCLIFYWYGLKCWFRQDDFAWLGLTAQVHSFRDLCHALFAPLAQGTIRPLSERAFFMGLYTLFGLDALPFRICVFVTQIANLTLIRVITERTTGSAAAGFWAAILWTANTALLTVMTWSSVYNQALCGFFLLLAFYFLLRYIETGNLRFHIAQWIAFLAGFGALEINVVYPALAAVYTLLCARDYFRRTLPLFIPSIVFTTIHRAVQPVVNAPAYALRFDSTMLGTFWQYLLWARGVNHYGGPNPAPAWVWPIGTALILASLAAFAIAQVRRGKPVALFFVAWFVIVLAPVLPLPYHLSEYYLTLPTVGLTMLAGWGLALAWQSRAVWQIAAVGLLLVYLSPLRVIRAESKSRYLLSRKISRMVMGVVEARELHPDQTILLRDVDDELFWNGVLDNPFQLIGVSNVYLAPESEGLLTPHPELGAISDFVLPAAVTLDRLKAGKVVVYSAAGDKLKNITKLYESTSHLVLRQDAPRRVQTSDDLMAYLLGSSWYPRDGTHRWMPKQATVRLGGPASAGQRLYLSGFCPAGQLASGALPVSVNVDGIPLPPVQIRPGTEQFNFDFALPATLVGKHSVEVAVEVGRTFRPPGEDRELGLAFGTFEIR